MEGPAIRNEPIHTRADLMFLIFPRVEIIEGAQLRVVLDV